ncbi:MAG: ATP-binding protein [SAR324 cluster bacterium]|nr:ATP-binding protein [SAR324 cluster bacterium]
MKFYNRDHEIKILRQLKEQSTVSSSMAVLTGRRRIGKTNLALEFAGSHKYLYFFIAKKSENLLCEEFLLEIKKLFSVPVIGEIRWFKDIFALLLEISKTEEFTLILDEFQEFYTINPAVYSEIQQLWDVNKDQSRLNLICIGSVYSLVNKIFQHAKEPLFGRADRMVFLKPFSVSTLNQILADYKIKDPRTLFDWYVLTGGMPKYIDSLISNTKGSLENILEFMVSEYSPFLHEGRHVLIEEFGKEYGTYFSILELISRGKTSRSAIESIVQRNIGGYLARLEEDYNLIDRIRPINSKPNARLVKYYLKDHFLRFWFRFIHRNWSAVETGNFHYIIQMIQRDFQTYCGPLLEQFFQDLFAASSQYNRLGSYWEKKHLNEIDLVAINDAEKVIVMAEIKLNKDRIKLNHLQEKSKNLLASYPGYKPRWLALGIEDIPHYLNTSGK